MTSTCQHLARVPGRDELAEMAGRAYAAAAVAGVSMHKAVDVIEPLRDHPSQDAWEVAGAFDGAVALTAGTPLGPIVERLRDDYGKAVADGLIAWCAAEFGVDPAAGLKAWLRAFGEALGEYRLLTCTALTEPGRLPTEAEDWRPTLQAATDHGRRDEWHLALPAIERLLGADVAAPGERAPLLAIACLIQLYRMDDTAAARRLAGEALADSPADPRAIAARARVLVWEGELDEAESILRDCLKNESRNGDVHQAYAMCARARGRSAEFEERLLEGIRKAPDEVQLYRDLLSLYATEELFSEREPRLLPIASQAAVLDPDSAYDIWLDLACVYRENGSMTHAKGLFEKAIAMDPSRSRGHLELARLHLAESQPDAADTELTTVLERDPANVEAMGVHAELCERQGDRSGVVAWRSSAAEVPLGNPGYRLAELARAQAAAGDGQGAWATACRALQAAPEVVVAELLSALATERWRTDPPAVQQLFETALAARDDGGRAELHNLMGVAAYDAGDAATAADEFRAAIALREDKAAFHRNLADALAGLGDWDGALASLEGAFALDDDQAAHQRRTASVLNRRGNAFYESADYARAESDYRSAAGLRPEEPVFWSNLALALEEAVPGAEQVDRLREAVDALGKAARLDPSGGYEVRLTRAQTHLTRLERFGKLIDKPVVLSPIVVEVAADLVPLVDPAQDGQPVFDDLLPAMRGRLEERLGFTTPGVRFRPASLPVGEFHVLLFETVRAAGTTAAESPDAVQVLLHCLESTVVRHAALLFGLDEADRWWSDHHREPELPAGSTREQRRFATARRLAAARALRACLGDGMRIDEPVAAVVADVIDEALGGDRTEPTGTATMAAAAAAAERARASFPDRLGAGPRHQLPAWAGAVLAERCLDATEEHRLLLEIQGLDRVDGAARLLVPPTAPRAYLARLVSGWEGGSERTTTVHTERVSEPRTS